MRTVKTDQTGRMPRLIRVFAGRTCHFVGFVKLARLTHRNGPKFLDRHISANSVDSSQPSQGRYCLSFGPTTVW